MRPCLHFAVHFAAPSGDGQEPFSVIAFQDADQLDLVGGVDVAVVGTVALRFDYLDLYDQSGLLNFFIERDFVKLPKQDVWEEDEAQ